MSAKFVVAVRVKSFSRSVSLAGAGLVDPTVAPAGAVGDARGACFAGRHGELDDVGLGAVGRASAGFAVEGDVRPSKEPPQWGQDESGMAAPLALAGMAKVYLPPEVRPCTC